MRPTLSGRWAAAFLSLALGLLNTLALQGAPKTPYGEAGFPAWQAKRAKSIGGTNGWSSLAGLLWLHEGTNSLGGGITNELKLPKDHSPEVVGNVIRTGYRARFVAASPGVAKINGKPVVRAKLKSDENGATPAVLQVDQLAITVIKRGERFGLRVRDPQAPTRLHFTGLDWFPYDPQWRLEGRLEKPATPRTLLIGDVTGVSANEKSPGTVIFTRKGQEYRLDALLDEDEHDLFVIFRDRTSGETTYGGGRFVHATVPDRQGRVIIDFNYAYNPPCAFTRYATCPIPPRQNTLPIAVEAGEKKYRGGHE
ncbi:MAG TPA: DUF1684 domain-containing protein [Candidatus Limnocylindria bacterium]|jgi:uncharacterized protein (DUF1684 family)|nr:DUF1684 domain-containing protein [Candidatus Limnocylindria bacterium]